MQVKGIRIKGLANSDPHIGPAIAYTTRTENRDDDCYNEDISNDKRNDTFFGKEDNAYKAIRFNKERYNGFYPDKEYFRDKSIILRKKSLYYVYYLLKQPNEALADAVANTGDDDEEPELSFNLFD
ncbi:hypothetical protein B0H65DRAFT_439641 [Neurospora tetraspora]|uniref:Uncharacterized protein n=1 Tax=Neurospora tetraspora TaxID=94610 RepID=A0AAE0JJM5_9PEZI|nr:hypothetical protein B0H65DRAFT_439641 [Neurospora tetraspora]